MMKKESVSRRIFVALNTLLMILLALACLLPFLHVLWASMSLPTRLQLHQGL